ncbi:MULTISPECIES: hypothetical protein [Peribacillus]|uniref:hypothetical protein n=1 Tax=Peribacillus TaxID=2675229 RepID=UPI002E20B83F|nr:hypothetical protein [Peribacillus frigoritolerans]
MFGNYLWKLRLLLFIPIVLYAIYTFSAIEKYEDYPSYYFLILAVYTIICSIILHKMEKKEKK